MFSYVANYVPRSSSGQHKKKRSHLSKERCKDQIPKHVIMEALQASGKETERIKYHQGRAQGSIRDTMLLLNGNQRH